MCVCLVWCIKVCFYANLFSRKRLKNTLGFKKKKKKKKKKPHLEVICVATLAKNVFVFRSIISPWDRDLLLQLREKLQTLLIVECNVDIFRQTYSVIK